MNIQGVPGLFHQTLGIGKEHYKYSDLHRNAMQETISWRGSCDTYTSKTEHE